MTKQYAMNSRASAGEPPNIFCMNTPPARCAIASVHRSRMHRGVCRSTRPAQITSLVSSSEPSIAGVTATSTSAPARRTLMDTPPPPPPPRGGDDDAGRLLTAGPPARPWRCCPFAPLAPCAGGRAPHSTRSASSMSRQLVIVWLPMLRSTSPGCSRFSDTPVGMIRYTRRARETCPWRLLRRPTAWSHCFGSWPAAPRASVATSMALTSTSSEGTTGGASGSLRRLSTSGPNTLAVMPKASVVSSRLGPCQSKAEKIARTRPPESHRTPPFASSGVSASTTISRFLSRKRGTSHGGNSSRPLGRYEAATVTRALKALPWLSKPTKCRSSPVARFALAPFAIFAARRGVLVLTSAANAAGSHLTTAMLCNGWMKRTTASTVVTPAKVTSTSPRDCGALWRSVSTRPCSASTRTPTPSEWPQ
mmetsp:Transcript_65243/g.183656  ORF Transcript_65243/g.183656 Transcript_65243/m.183656 type:complete len:421 (+) Transcript_65243:259-1521(+)